MDTNESSTDSMASFGKTPKMTQMMEIMQTAQDQLTRMTSTHHAKALMMQESEYIIPTIDSMASVDISDIQLKDCYPKPSETAITPVPICLTSSEPVLKNESSAVKLKLHPNVKAYEKIDTFISGLQTESKPCTNALVITEDKASMTHISEDKASANENKCPAMQICGNKVPIVTQASEDEATIKKIEKSGSLMMAHDETKITKACGVNPEMKMKKLEDKDSLMPDIGGKVQRTMELSINGSSRPMKESEDQTMMKVSGDIPPMTMDTSRNKTSRNLQTDEDTLTVPMKNSQDKSSVAQRFGDQASLMALKFKNAKRQTKQNSDDNTYNISTPQKEIRHCSITDPLIYQTKTQDAGAAVIICSELKINQFSPHTCAIDPTKAEVCEATFDGSGEVKDTEPLPGSQQNPSPQANGDSQQETCLTEQNASAFVELPESKQPPPTEKLEVIVAHYDEDLNWLHPFLKNPDVKVSIYSKGGKNLAPELHNHTIYLDNIGRQGHTYLYHIVTRYDSLSEILLFCQGDPFNHLHVDYTPKELLRDALDTPICSFATFKGQSMERFDQWDGIQIEDSPTLQRWGKTKVKPAARTPAGYWSLFMAPRGHSVPLSIGFAPGSNFSVTKSMIRHLTRAFWAQMFREFFLGPMEDVNPMTGYICERFWAAILYPAAFTMYPGDIPHTVKHDMKFGRLTRGNWKVLPKDSKEFIPGATPHDLAIALGVDALDKEIAREMHTKAEITISSGESSDTSPYYM